MIRTLALDIGQSTGWAMFEDKALKEYGNLRFKRTGHRRSVALIRALLWRFNPHEVAVEHVRFSKFPDAHASYWRIRTLFELEAEGVEVESFVEVQPSVLKKWATGQGNASKALMCAAARKLFAVDLWGEEEVAPDDRTKAQRKREEDQADAILVGAWSAERKNILANAMLRT